MGKVAKQSFYNSINSYIGVGLGALNTMILFPRIFEPETYGDFQSLMAIITIIATFAHLGFPTSVVVFFPKLSAKKRAALWTYMLVGISIVGLLLGISLALIQYFQIYKVPNALIGFIVCLSIIYFELLSALSQHHSKVVLPQFLRNVFRRLIITLALASSLFIEEGLQAFYMIFGLGYLIHLIIMLLYAKPDLPPLKWQPQLVDQKSNLQYGLMVMLATGSIILVSKIDILMIKSMLGSAEVAFYFIAFFIGSVVSVPVKSVIASIRPFVAKAWARDDLAEIDKLYKKSAITQLAITGFLLLLIVTNLDILLYFLPLRYHFEAFPMVVLCIGLGEVVKGATGINGMILTVSKKQHFNFYSGLFLLALTVLGNWLLIPILGLTGAALASLIAISLFNLFKLFIVQKLFKLIPLSKAYWVLLFCIAISLFALSLMANAEWPLWLKLAAGNAYAFGLLLMLFKYSKALDDFKVFKFLKS